LWRKNLKLSRNTTPYFILVSSPPTGFDKGYYNLVSPPYTGSSRIPAASLPHPDGSSYLVFST
jgi:hypothetical protein